MALDACPPWCSILVLAFVVHGARLPTLGPGETVRFGGLQLLVLFTLVGMLAGAYVIWDLGRIFARMGAVMASETAMSGFERRRDEVGTIMSSFNKMLVTIEQQAAEINTFATRARQPPTRSWSPPTPASRKPRSRTR